MLIPRDTEIVILNVVIKQGGFQLEIHFTPYVDIEWPTLKACSTIHFSMYLCPGFLSGPLMVNCLNDQNQAGVDESSS